MEWTISVWSTSIFRTNFEGGPFLLVWSFQLVGPKCPFPFEKIAAPSTALLYPAYKNNNQMCGSLGQVFTTHLAVEFWKFQTGFFVEWKAPRDSNSNCATVYLNDRTKCMLYVLRHPTSCIA